MLDLEIEVAPDAGLGNRLFVMAMGIACAAERPDLAVGFVGGHEVPSFHSNDAYADLVAMCTTEGAPAPAPAGACACAPEPAHALHADDEGPGTYDAAPQRMVARASRGSGRGSLRLRGRFQSPRYFQGYADAVERTFVGWMEARAAAEVDAWCRERRVDPAEAFFVHVRLGDFVGDHRCLFGDRAERFLSASLDDWTSTAVGRVGSSTVAVVLSNEPDRVAASHPCVQAVLGGAGVRTVSVGPELGEVGSLLLMSRCALGGVVPASTFSWWAAWLLLRRHRAARVYTPDPWPSSRGGCWCDLQFEPVSFE